MEKVNLQPYHAYFSICGLVFKLIHNGTIPRDILAYSDFVFDSDGTVLKSRYPSGSKQFKYIVHLIRKNDDIKEYCFDPENPRAIDLFVKRITNDYTSFMSYNNL